MATHILTDDSFEEEVLNSPTPVLVDFWAEWCGPCKLVDPLVEELSTEYDGKIKFTKMNVDENIKAPSNYNVMSIPSLIIFKDGQPQKTLVGVQPKDVFKKALDEVITS